MLQKQQKKTRYDRHKADSLPYGLAGSDYTIAHSRQSAPTDGFMEDLEQSRKDIQCQMKSFDS